MSIYCILIAVAAGAALLQMGAPIDDAYISFVYAHNFADGLGFVFNPGHRIEGYSNFLWVFILGLANRALDLDIPMTAQVSGVVLAAVNVILVYSIARRFINDEKSAGWAFSAALLTALDLRVAAWSVEGLETPLYLFFILGALRSYRDPKLRWIVGAACFGAAITRPEGPLLFIALALHRIYMALRKRESFDKHDAVTALLFILPYATYNIWRIYYFGGAVLPNTFYARGGAGIVVGTLYILFGFYRAWGPLAPLFLGLALYGAWKSPACKFAVPTFVIIDLVAVAALGGDWMYNARFLVPVLPLLMIMAVSGASRIGVVNWPSRENRFVSASEMMGKFVPFLNAGTLLVVAMIATQVVDMAVYELTPGFEKNWSRHQDRFYMPVAGKLDELGARGHTVAFSDIGYVGYYTGAKIIDTLGIVDRHLARRPEGPQWNTDLDYVLDLRPGFVVNMIRHYGDVELGHTAFDRATLVSGRFHDEYELVSAFHGYDAEELSWDDFELHEYSVEFRIWKRKDGI